MTRSLYYHRYEAPNNEPKTDLGVKIEAGLDKNGCTYVPSVALSYLKSFIKLNQMDRLECWLAEGNNERLGIVAGKDNNCLLHLMECYQYPALLLNGLITE